jgi:lipopolysaccharide exporter
MSQQGSRHSLGIAVARGAGWMVALQVLVKFISIISTLILARLLVPEDFGVYVTAMALFSFIQLFRAFGFGVALIQNQNATAEHYNTAWTLHLCFSVSAALLLYICASPFAQFLEEERLVPVVKVLALIFVVDGITNIGIFNLQKNMLFDKEFQRQLYIKLAGFIVTIPLAFILRSYWAMIYGLIASTVCAVILSYLMQPYRPGLSFAKTREMMKFASWLQINNFLTYANEHAQNIVVSKLAGTAPVGVLSLSKDVGSAITVELLEPINRAAYPAYAKAADCPADLGRLFTQVFGVLSLVSFPLGVGVFSLAQVFVPLLLGEKWLQAIPVIQLLALASIALVLTSPVSYLFLAMARQKMTSMLHAIRLILLVMLLIPLVSTGGVDGAALALLASAILMLPVNLIMVSHVAGIGWGELMRLVYRPIFASLIMYLALNYVLASGSPDQGFFLAELAVFLGLVTLGALVYLVSILLTWYLQGKPGGPETLTIGLMRRRGFK